jgi:hypothetical protein
MLPGYKAGFLRIGAEGQTATKYHREQDSGVPLAKHEED